MKNWCASVLGGDAVCYKRNLPTFRRDLVPLSSGHRLSRAVKTQYGYEDMVVMAGIWANLRRVFSFFISVLLFPCNTYIFTPNLETAGSSETLENLHETTGHYNPEDFKFISSQNSSQFYTLISEWVPFFKSQRQRNVPRAESIIPKTFDEELMLFILTQNGFRSAGSFIPRSAGSIVVENEGVITALAWLLSWH